MVFIPPPHMMKQGPTKPTDPHELTVGMFVVFVVFLGIALFIFIAGPRSNNPPPLVAGYAVLVLALVFGFVSFFAWMKEQGDGGESVDDGNTTDRGA